MVPRDLSNIYTYHSVRKVCATHIMLDRRTTIMALIQCTGQSHAVTGHINFLYFYKKVLNQRYSNTPQQYRLFHHRD